MTSRCTMLCAMTQKQRIKTTRWNWCSWATHSQLINATESKALETIVMQRSAFHYVFYLTSSESRGIKDSKYFRFGSHLISSLPSISLQPRGVHLLWQVYEEVSEAQEGAGRCPKYISEVLCGQSTLMCTCSNHDPGKGACTACDLLASTSA